MYTPDMIPVKFSKADISPVEDVEYRFTGIFKKTNQPSNPVPEYFLEVNSID